MILAVDQMDPVVQGIFFLIAVVLFVIAGINLAVPRVNLIALGLAFFSFVFMWNAFAAS